MNNLGSRAWFFAPLASVALFSVATRTAAGTFGIAVKGLSNIVNKVGEENIRKNLNTTGDNLIAFATRNPKKEIGLITSLTILGVGAYGIAGMMSNSKETHTYLRTPPVENEVSSSAYRTIVNLIPAGLLLGGGAIGLSATKIKSNQQKREEQPAVNSNLISLDLTNGEYVGFKGKNSDGEYVPHGQGTFTAKDGTRYEGQFEYGKFKSGNITYHKPESYRF